jgi:site-specific recombinase XerD
VDPLFASVLRDDLAAYVTFRRALGFDLRSQVYTLVKFDRVVGRTMAKRGPVMREIVEAFLRGQAGLAPLTRKRQLSDVRLFCLYLRHTELESFVPDRDMEPGRGAPRAPHIYSPDEIRTLLAGALALRFRPRGALRPRTYHCLLALLYATGMRISEALALDLGDLDLRQDLLRIRRTKFHKSRLVPLAASTVVGLKHYLVLRAEHGSATSADASLLVGERGQRIPYRTALGVFIRIARKAGLRGPPGNSGPRLHDIRHTYAIDRLLGWYREGKDVQALLPVLSTYLGHARVTDTQVYLHTTEEILTLAGERFHRRFPFHHQSPGEPS